MAKIKGLGGGKGGGNERYRVGNRTMSRPALVKEVKAGLHPEVHILKVNRKEYVRDNPDRSKDDNVND